MKNIINNLNNWIVNNKGKSILIIVFVVGLILSLTTAIFYTGQEGNTKTVTMANLDVDYIDGETINFNNALPLTEDEINDYASTTTFQVSNNGDIDSYFDINLSDVVIDSALKTNQCRWRLLENDYIINEGGFKNSDTIINLDKSIFIKIGSTNTYKLQLWIQDNEKQNQNQLQNKTLNAKISIKGYSINTNRLSDKIKGNINDRTKGFVKLNNEYIYNGPRSTPSTLGGDTVNNNYVWFNGQMWRIMRLDNQGIKLILDYSVTSISYGTGNTDSYKWDTSYAKDWLENIFYPTIKRKSMVNNSKWCIKPMNDVTVENYTASGMSTEKVTGFTPTSDCYSNSNNYSEGYIGLMTFDEYVYALNANNQSGTIGGSYLDKDEYEWTMTPFTTGYTNKIWYTFSVNPGHIEKKIYGTDKSFGIRPVIYLNSDSMTISGEGTKNNPYMIYGDSIGDPNNTLNSRTPGEYVLYSGKKFRIVSTNMNGTTKLKQDENDGNKPFYSYNPGDGSVGCYSGNTTLCQTDFNPNYPSTTGNTYNQNGMNIGYYLNSASDGYLSTLSNPEWIVPSTWKRKVWVYGNKYDKSENNTLGYSDLTNTKVGLIRVGEMMSGNDINILTFTITPSSINTKLNCMYAIGSNVVCDSYSAYGIRPVINLDSRIFISSGNGTTSNPYILKYED